MLNKTSTSTFSNTGVKYKQTNITCYFGNKKMILKTSENKYKNSKQIDATVELSDSDSDSYFEKSQNRSISPKKKIKLPFPIFDDDDSNNENERSSGETMGQMSRLECKRSGTREELFPVASSTPCKQGKKSNEDTLSDIAPINITTSSDDTIIVSNPSSICKGGPVQILQNTVLIQGSNNRKARDNKRLKKTIGQLPETLFKKQQKHTPISALENEKFSPSKSFKITLHDSYISTIFGEDKEMNVSVQNGLQKTSMILNAESESESCQVKVITTSKQHISSAQIIPSTPGQNITKSRPEKSIGSPKNANSPRKTISGPSTTAKIMSPPKRQNRDKSRLKPEEQEGETLNFESLNCIKELFQNTLVDDDQKKLLMKRDIEVIEDFLKMNVLYQYLLMKLFLYLPKWYNIMKFCSRIKLDQKMTSKEITVMYMYLKNNGYVETDISALGVEELLSMLSVVELKQICTKLKVGKTKLAKPKLLFKCKSGRKDCGKQDLMDVLKKNCRTQPTLFFKESSEDILKGEVYKCLGFRFKLKDDIKDIFFKTYILHTFTNSFYMDPEKYLTDITYLKIVYPDYSIERYNPFSNRERYMRFFEAISLKKLHFDAAAKRQSDNMRIYCEIAFERLKNIPLEGKWSRHVPDYLQRFSAEYQYISILKNAAKHLIKHYENVKTWLDFLIANYKCHYALGSWYKQLAHIQSHYMKDNEAAAQTIIEALEFNKKENLFNLVQIYDLSTIAAKIRTTKTFKLSPLFCDELALLAEEPINSDKFSKKAITCHTDRSGKPGKRTYAFIDENNEENFGSVEMIVLHHYRNEENYNGIHCEGSLLVLLFTLFFWDIIYIYYVPNTFISKLQHAPLDMYSESFYKNRRDVIEERLKDIAGNWTDEILEKNLKNNWDIHSHEESITKFNCVTEFKDLLKIFKCIDRKILSLIFERLVINYKRFRSGLPDLFLWKTETSESKFVEVKGENDKLSLTQKIWIQYLTDIGANVEVCHVSGVGGRKIKSFKAKVAETDIG